MWHGINFFFSSFHTHCNLSSKKREKGREEEKKKAGRQEGIPVLSE